MEPITKINNDMHNIVTRDEIEKSLENYPLIPMNEIEDEARLIAVRWVENYGTMGFDIQNKHKLASDIMNYAKRQKLNSDSTAENKGQQKGDKPEELQEEVERLRAALENISTMQISRPSEAENRFYDCIDIAEEALNQK